MIAIEEQTDEALFSAARGGDQDAFGKLVSRHRDRYVACAARILGNLEDAEDIVQETAYYIFAQLQTCSVDCPFSAWMYKCVIRAAHWGPRKRSVFSREIAEDWQYPAASGLSPYDSAIRNERVELVQGALNRIPEPYCTTVKMRVIEGLKLAEIAETLGQPMATVIGDVYHGESLLRLELETLPAGVLL